MNSKDKPVTQQKRVYPDLSDTTEYLTISVEDLALYFQDTFLFFRDTNSWEQVQQVMAAHGGPIIMSSDGHKAQETKLKLRDPVFAFPDMGLYNYKSGVQFFYRKSMRQNKKGLCSGNAGFMSTLKLFEKFQAIPYTFQVSQSWRWTPQNLNILFVTSSPNAELEEVYTAVSRLKNFARILNRNFFVGQGIDSKCPSLWFRQTLIGDVCAKNKVVIRNESFMQEALDYFSPEGVSVETSF